MYLGCHVNLSREILERVGREFFDVGEFLSAQHHSDSYHQTVTKYFTMQLLKSCIENNYRHTNSLSTRVREFMCTKIKDRSQVPRPLKMLIIITS